MWKVGVVNESKKYDSSGLTILLLLLSHTRGVGEHKGGTESSESSAAPGLALLLTRGFRLLLANGLDPVLPLPLSVYFESCALQRPS